MVTVEQLGNPSAWAIARGITFQAVFVNSTAPLCRLGSDGSAMRKIPTESAVKANWNAWLVPAAVITSTLALPDAPSSDGSTTLICPPVPATTYNGIAAPFTSTDKPWNVIAGKMLPFVFSEPKLIPNKLTKEFAA